MILQYQFIQINEKDSGYYWHELVPCFVFFNTALEFIKWLQNCREYNSPFGVDKKPLKEIFAWEYIACEGRIQLRYFGNRSVMVRFSHYLVDLLGVNTGFFLSGAGVF